MILLKYPRGRIFYFCRGRRLPAPESGVCPCHNPRTKISPDMGTKSGSKPRDELQPPQTRSSATMAQVKALRIFPSKDDLDDQCNVCLENLEICLEITARAATPLSATGVAVFLEQRLRDYRLFLKIWMTDCRVKDHGLSKATLSRDSALGNLLSRSFHSLDSELRFIAGELTDSSSAAASLASQR